MVHQAYVVAVGSEVADQPIEQLGVTGRVPGFISLAGQPSRGSS